jgi:putative ABC transport system permease protein
VFLSESLRLAIEAIKAQKLRSALTMLGMAIGVFAVVSLVALGNGAKEFVLQQFQSLGSNFIIIQPGKTDKKTMMGPPIGSAQRRMTISDVNALERRSLNLDAVSGLVLSTAQVRNDESIANITVLGVGEQFPQIISLLPADGAFFQKEEVDTGRRVIVLGANTSRKLFGDEAALGRSVKLNQTPFKVICVLKPMGNKLGLDLDEIAFIPVVSAMRVFNEDKLFGIRAKATSKVSTADAVNEITEILKERRQGEEDFTVLTQQAMTDTLDEILGMLSYVLGGIASISMLVGGVGIMNIMLVSVTERIPEIGIRRAVGARKKDILTQFLTEALLLSVLSGTIGLSVALGITHGMRVFYPSFDMRPPWWIVVGAIVVSVSIGVFFGVWPAKKAANIEALDALRRE